MSQVEALSSLIATARRRAERHDTRFVDVLPRPQDIYPQEDCTVGVFSLRCNSSLRRYILAPAAVVIADGLAETPTTLARDYITLKVGKRGPKVVWEQAQAIAGKLNKVTSPQLCRPGKYDYGVYLDLKATYFSVILRAGWDVDYWPGRWVFNRGIDFSDFPLARHKMTRNCLVSVGLLADVQKFHPDKGWYTRRVWNKLLNTQLYCLIYDVLNGIATEVERECKSLVYVNTDGYILTSPADVARATEIILAWGLTPRVKGETPRSTSCRITAPGQYYVSRDCRSRRNITKEVPYKKIRQENYFEWLKENMLNFKEALKITEEDLC